MFTGFSTSVSSSVKDFLNFFEILTEYDVEFVCLKQNYDTTSSQGKLFITIMMALAEFEREQTSERNKDACLARAERGLWNGGQILGYDPNAEKKGYLIVNEKEKALIQFAFNKYLECGSLMETAVTLNEHGYRTKEYTSRRDTLHPARTFGRTSIRHILANHVYVGKKEVNKRKKDQDQNKLPDNEKYRIVPAVWDAIIDEETFEKVQYLIAKNTVTRHNQTADIKHTYILNGSLLWCEHCNTQMEGRSGTGQGGIRYYYYKCTNKDCGFKLPANEIENVIIQKIKQISLEKNILETVVTKTNQKLQKELPQLQSQKTALQKELDEVKVFAEKIMNQWMGMSNPDTSIFVKDKLDKLGKRRKEIETGINALEEMITEIEEDSVTKELVEMALQNFNDLFDSLKPYQKKELINIILHKALITKNSLKVAIYAKYPQLATFTMQKKSQSDISRSGTTIWLPEVDSSQTPQPQCIQLLVRLYKRKRKRFELSVDQPFPNIASKVNMPKNIVRQALDVKAHLTINPNKSFRHAAEHFNITVARISQLVKIVDNLPPHLIKELENSKDPILLRRFSGRRLLKIVSFETQNYMEQAIESLMPSSYE